MSSAFMIPLFGVAWGSLFLGEPWAQVCQGRAGAAGTAGHRLQPSPLAFLRC